MATTNFVGGSYELKRRKADVQRSINLMPTAIESGSGKSPMYLAPVPGLVVFTTADGEIGESSYTWNRFYWFTGTTYRDGHELTYDDVHIT